MGTIDIQYRFGLKNGHSETIDIRLDDRTLDRINLNGTPPPEWTELGFQQCPLCPLTGPNHPHCPVALGLADIAHRFDTIVSYDEIDLEVVTRERRVTQQTTAQRAISSLLGLIIATSGCPHTAYFKPMARFHLPLASEENTIYRAAGMYLLAQFFLRKEDSVSDPGLTGLRRIYENLHQVNLHIARRLKSATLTDSSVNAIVLLDSFTSTLPYVIEDHLDEITYLFTAYHSDAYQQILAEIAPDTDPQ
ncbi:DUF6901 family protein [Sedimenticola hydrogenitrophicus]|uniref:DUF6901 family protein n=1 Tax=Sedimenticola hydrogenitrophicus TaxID=2967975 RepID=UPI0023B14836|nr:hypothetical protein [Sedimenticola hydrogenitrophicus]